MLTETGSMKWLWLKKNPRDLFNGRVFQAKGVVKLSYSIVRSTTCQNTKREQA